MTREQLEALILTAPTAEGKARQHRRLHGIENYLFIGGGNMSARQAAERIGRTERTIIRYRKILRGAASSCDYHCGCWLKGRPCCRCGERSQP